VWNSAITAPHNFSKLKKRNMPTGVLAKVQIPIALLAHFTGTLDNWDPAVTDPLAADHDITLFDNAGVGGSTGTVPTTMAGMAEHGGDIGSHSDDLADWLVAENSGKWAWKVPERLVHIGIADAAGAHLHQHLARAGLRLGNISNLP
jgi:pimeloyl-ACP methyl ester carboxylesterase